MLHNEKLNLSTLFLQFQPFGTTTNGTGSIFLKSPQASFPTAFDCSVDLPLVLKSNNNSNSNDGHVKDDNDHSQSQIRSIQTAGNKVQNTNLLESIINDSISNDGSTLDGLKYSQKQHLYNKFYSDTALKNSEPAYIQFFDSASQGNLGKFHTLEELFFLVTDTSQIYNNEALVNFYLDSANVINQNIIPQIIVETNKKTINNLYINKMVKNNFNFTANEKQNVSNIASQCPYAGGPAVTEARAIERVWNDTILHDDTWLCMPAPEIGKHEKSEKLTDGIFVYPNPAKDVLNVRSDIKGTIILTDVTGRQITKTKNENLITTIDTRRVNQGVYLLSVYISDKLFHAIRVVIIK